MTKARDLANIISGGFTADDIPNLDASKITSGSIADARLPATALNSNVDLTNLSASNLTSGTIPTARITALPSGVGGKVLQVVTATDSTFRDTTSTSFVTASNTLSLNITPSATSSKIYLLATFTGYGNTSGKSHYYTFYRDSTNLGDATNGLINTYDTNSTRIIGKPMAMSILDSPNSTSEITYQVYIKAESGGHSIMNYSDNKGSITAYEIAG